MMTENFADEKYRCPTCGSEKVDVTEFEDHSKMVPERVHIYCEDSDCGWTHRSLMRNGTIVHNA